jgi:hypothetical protein
LNLVEINLGEAIEEQELGESIHFSSFLGCNQKLKDKCHGVDYVIPKNWRTRFVALFFQTEGTILLALMRLLLSISLEMLRQLEICARHILLPISTHVCSQTIEKSILCLNDHLH